MRLSMSKPVRCARSNRLGGFQYLGTNASSVKPNGAVSTLAQNIGTRSVGLATNSTPQGTRKELAQMSHTYRKLGAMLGMALTCVVLWTNRSSRGRSLASPQTYPSIVPDCDRTSLCIWSRKSNMSAQRVRCVQRHWQFQYPCHIQDLSQWWCYP